MQLGFSGKCVSYMSAAFAMGSGTLVVYTVLIYNTTDPFEHWHGVNQRDCGVITDRYGTNLQLDVHCGMCMQEKDIYILRKQKM